MTSGALVLLALAGCGNWSAEDVRFLAALPTREDLRVVVPDSGTANALAACGAGSRTADTWLAAKPTSDLLNAAVDLVIRLVDTVRRVEPTARREDERRWGPWNDREHPGIELLVSITRAPEEDGQPVFGFSFEARREGDGVFVPFITGTFHGATAEGGWGELSISFETLWSLGMNDPDTPHGSLQAQYDRTGATRKVAIQAASHAAVLDFTYRFEGWPDGSGAFLYSIPSGFNVLEIASGFDAAGAGRGRVTYHMTFPVQLEAEYLQCWDATACLVFVDDPGNYSCDSPDEPCSLGDVGACPAVPLSPF